MVRMIPERPREGANRSEQRLFDSIASIVGHDDWIAFHSLEIARHVTWWQGEADFVVVMPGLGIVVVEAKAPTAVRYVAGQWHLEGVPGRPNKDPFRQADGARRSIRQHLAECGIRVEELPIARLVWFTSISRQSFQNPTPGDLQFAEWELAWQNDLTDAGAALSRTINQFGAWHRAAGKRWVNPSWFEGAVVERASDALVMDFVAVQSIADQHRERQVTEERLLEEQLFALDLMEPNTHVYFEGPAGTGKSYVVAAAAQRFAARGLATLVTCVNVLMAERLHELIGPDDHVDVLDLNSLMLSVCGLGANPDAAGNEWYREELPRRTLERLAEFPYLGDYQAICVDEFQDVAVEPLWVEVLAALGEQPLAETPVVFAGDDRQAIMSRGSGTSVAVAGSLVPSLAKAALRRNCRIAPKLVEGAEHVVGHPLGFVGHRVAAGTPGGLWREPVGDDAAATLDRALTWLLGFHDPSEVVILSPFGNKSLAARLLAEGDDATRKTISQVRWYSIAKFKGMEAEAVIVTDLGTEAREWVTSIGIDYDDLVYVGLTRAKYRCVVIDA